MCTYAKIKSNATYVTPNITSTKKIILIIKKQIDRKHGEKNQSYVANCWFTIGVCNYRRHPECSYDTSGEKKRISI